MCFVSRRWRELGQAIVWRYISIFPMGTSLDRRQALLFHDSATSHRLGRYIKELEIDAVDVFSEPDFDDVSEADSEGFPESRMPLRLERNEFDFALSWCRKLLAVCSGLEYLEIFDFDAAGLRTILEEASSSAATLRVFTWHQQDVYSEYLPVRFTPSEFVLLLSVFTKLEEVDIDITLPATTDQATRLLTLPRPSPVTTLFLTSLQLESSRGAPGPDDTNEEAEPDFTKLLLQAVSKETLRKIWILSMGASPVGALLKVLAQLGFHLESLELRSTTLPPSTLSTNSPSSSLSTPTSLASPSTPPPIPDKKSLQSLATSSIPSHTDSRSFCSACMCSIVASKGRGSSRAGRGVRSWRASR